MNYIGLISDTHDHLERVRAVVAVLNQFNLKRVIHCGDIVASFVLSELRHLDAPLSIVFGNCDGDRDTLREFAHQYSFDIKESLGEMEIEGKRIVVTHKPVLPYPSCDFYIHGHTHKIRYEYGNPVIINPGEVCGWLTGKSSIAVLNIDIGDVEFITL